MQAYYRDWFNVVSYIYISDFKINLQRLELISQGQQYITPTCNYLITLIMHQRSSITHDRF